MLKPEGKYTEAEALYRELLALQRPLLPPDDPDLASSLAFVATAMLAQDNFTEAESFICESLAICAKKIPDYWLTSNARSLLGGSLLGQKKYAEAEPLLVSGYEGMKQREDQIPAAGKPRLKEALQRLADLYGATDRPQEAAEWRQKLAEATKQPGTP